MLLEADSEFPNIPFTKSEAYPALTSINGVSETAPFTSWDMGDTDGYLFDAVTV